MMILVSDFITEEMFDAARDKAAQRPETPPTTARFASFNEGRCLQTMHIGTYDDESQTLASLHKEITPQSDLTFNGRHHEIYISDPRRIAPTRLKTVLRQPVRPIER